MLKANFQFGRANWIGHEGEVPGRRLQTRGSFLRMGGAGPDKLRGACEIAVPGYLVCWTNLERSLRYGGTRLDRITYSNGRHEWVVSMSRRV